jgi:hypothetical protein
LGCGNSSPLQKTADRLIWAKEKGKVVSLQKELRELKNDLSLELDIMSLYVTTVSPAKCDLRYPQTKGRLILDPGRNELNLQLERYHTSRDKRSICREGYKASFARSSVVCKRRACRKIIQTMGGFPRGRAIHITGLTFKSDASSKNAATSWRACVYATNDITQV